MAHLAGSWAGFFSLAFAFSEHGFVQKADVVLAGEAAQPAMLKIRNKAIINEVNFFNNEPPL